MRHSTISVAIATYNEAENISRCLDSVAAWVDEIVIVDGKSTDKTEDLIKKYQKKYSQIKLIITDNRPMFHLNKQMAIDAATSSWILQLDADEVVSPRLKKEIIKILNQNLLEIKFNGFWINRRNYFLGRFLSKGGQYPDPTIRFYKKGKGKLPCFSVHEQAKIDGPVGNLFHHLYHYADADFSRYLLRNNRYTSLMAKDLSHQKLPLNFFTFLSYFFIKPETTFFSIYFRHKGFMDGFPGLVFAYYSSISHRAAFVKYYGQKIQNRH